VASVRRFVDAFNRLDLDSVVGDIHPAGMAPDYQEEKR
jgi:hypothetical protein